MTTSFESIPSRLAPLFVEADKPWIPLDRLARFVRSEVRPGNHGVVKRDLYIEGDVEIGRGTIIEPGVVILGPTIIGENCALRAGAYIRENVVTGSNCVIGHATEVVRSILLDGVRLDHLNYAGDSILGNRVHFGAGSKTPNLRFDERNIIIDGQDTGRQKLGVILGDGCQLGVNVTLGPGIVFAPNTCYAGSNLLPPGVYDPDSIRAAVRR